MEIYELMLFCCGPVKVFNGSAEGNDLEWQFKFQQRTEERLPEYAGTLRALADKAYPGADSHTEFFLRGGEYNGCG